jgi:TM2 domain-containing protein/RING finger family protein
MTIEVCPYCRAPIGAADSSLECEGCGTRHHADCYAENGGCTIFGCSKAPGDEPKVSVSAPELVAVTGSTSIGDHRQSPPPPPPPPGIASPQTTLEELRHVANQVVPSMFGGFGAESPAPTVTQRTQDVRQPKDRTTFILLGALLGAFGAHSFYAGYSKKGWIQLAITLLTLGFGSPMSWMWAVIDICTINSDSHGVQFES